MTARRILGTGPQTARTLRATQADLVDALRQTCIDVLCTYLQLPFTPDPGDDPAHQEQHLRYLELRKVRHTILHLIGEHYQRPQGIHGSWQGCNLDLKGVTIDGRMHFSGATFSNNTVNFRGAAFSGGGVVLFDGATFAKADLFFDNATFSGGCILWLGDATYSDSRVAFGGATFTDGHVFLGDSTFSNCTVDFERATFSASGTVNHGGTTLTGSSANFNNVTFTGSEVSFLDAVGPAPDGLLSALGTLAPAAVTLPPAWQPPSP